jgi:hypothetical protein
MSQIWKIYSSRDLNNQFARYKQSIERLRNKPDGNVCRRFHGTTRMCKLGDDDDKRNGELCSVASCSLCSIIRVGLILLK